MRRRVGCIRSGNSYLQKINKTMKLLTIVESLQERLEKIRDYLARGKCGNGDEGRGLAGVEGLVIRCLLMRRRR